MPRLLLLRHSKSVRPGGAIDDFDRPLNERGRLAAPLVARHLVALGLAPQKILCSSSRRTRETLLPLLRAFDEDIELRLTRDLYLAEEDRVIDQIRAHGNGSRTLLVIGHDPGLQHAALTLIGAGNPSLIEDLEAKFPTSGLAVIDFPAGKWVDVEPKTGRLVAFLHPRQMEALTALPEDDEA